MKTNDRSESGTARIPAIVLLGMILGIVVLPLLLVWGGDITPGYTFTSGEQNVTHTKLNNAAAGTINTTFYSGKSSAGTDPNTAFELLLRDTSLDVFKRTTLADAIFNHSALLNSRTAKTAPVVGDGVFLIDSEASSAYKQMTLSNALYAGAASTAPDGNTRFPALRGGALGSITYSNAIGALASHSLPTNGDALAVLTENGRAVKQLTLQNLVTGAQDGTNYTGTDVILSWDGTRLRANKATNLISGITSVATVIGTNDRIAIVQSNVLKQTAVNTLKTAVRYDNIVQSKYTATTNIAGSSGNWSNVVALGSSSLSNAITTISTASKVLVRVVLHGAAAGASQPAFVRVLRGGSAIGTGDDDGGARTEAGAVIDQGGQLENVVFEWLDSPGTAGELTYWVQVKIITTGTVYINRTSADSASESNGRLVSTLTLQEVYQ